MDWVFDILGLFLLWQVLGIMCWVLRSNDASNILSVVPKSWVLSQLYVEKSGILYSLQGRV